MPLDPKEMALLWDMLDGARNAVQFSKDLQYVDFLKDRKRSLLLSEV
jgi:hypothetical protein